MNIPIIHTRGSHYEVGYQIGSVARGSLRAMHQKTRSAYGERWAELLACSPLFLAPTEQHLPRVVEEIRGCAEGAGVPFDDLFLMSVEELLYEEVRGGLGSPPSQGGGRGGQHLPQPFARAHALLYNCSSNLYESVCSCDLLDKEGSNGKGCSDLAAAAPATADGHVWLAHNNDLGRGAKEHLYVTYFRATGEPEILAVTVGGLFISIGMNSAGISLTGNQLYANDSRVGVPRLLVVRDILAQDNFNSALNSALLPERASSYNNLIASGTGAIVNVEGSATDYALIRTKNGVTTHTNHYIADKMKRFEYEAHAVRPSAARCARADYYAQKYRGKISYEVCERFLRDHVFAPWSVCKHAGQSVTVFSAIIDLTEQKIWLARGNPCQNEFELYTFDQIDVAVLQSVAVHA